ncbi:MAG TPA: DUF6051 family protein [Bacteroidales bacterium]|nr:DUF6051 family protein [Bacteroidales bacterium]
MDYTLRYNELKTLFSTDAKKIYIPGSEITINNCEFKSDPPLNGFSNSNDDIFPENTTFTYPVFSPGVSGNDNVILLFHGLNERSWIKYLTWAYYLCELTGSKVILFPISFHINRSPEAWKDPRKMSAVMSERKTNYGEISMLSFANVALSDRLSEDPLRFFYSGHRTVYDVSKLVKSIRNNENEIIPSSGRIDIFAYSIGAFLSQIIMMANPDDLFTESRLFMFCGGSVFSNMNGESKLIMDKRAFDRIYKYYMRDFEPCIGKESPMFDFFNSNKLGLAFRSMVDFSRLSSFRQKVFNNLEEKMHSLSLTKDKVIPIEGILKTMCFRGKYRNVEVADFPYEYSHENPFPIFLNGDASKVNSCFEKVMTKAASFLSRE